MKKLLLILALICSYSSEAQNTLTPTGTVTDTDSQVWANATVNFSLVYSGIGNPVYSSTGQKVPLSCTSQLNASGSFTGMVSDDVLCQTSTGQTSGLPNNASIIPAYTTWRMTICSATSAPCQTIAPVYVTPSNINLGAYISGLITAPRIQAAPTVYAYNANEIINQTNGSGYTNTISAISYLWNGSWTAIGGGGGGSGITSFQGRTTPAATLQESDVSGILSSGSYGITSANCGVQSGQGYWYTISDGIANCDPQTEAGNQPGQTIYSNDSGAIIAEIGNKTGILNSYGYIGLSNTTGIQTAYMSGDGGGTISVGQYLWNQANVTCIGTDGGGQFVNNSSACTGGNAYLKGTTGTIGGIGSCQSGTATVTGAVAGNAAVASPASGSLPTIINSIIAYVSAADTVTVTVCTIGLTSGVPSATYSVAVFP